MADKYIVYKHTAPDGMVYIGVTNNYKNRCYKSLYRSNPFKDYIEKYGWKNFKHEIIKEFDNKNEALDLEDSLIEHYQNLAISLNKYRSGSKFLKETKKKKQNKDYL